MASRLTYMSEAMRKTQPLCAICQHPVPATCDICNDCRQKYELGAGVILPEWAQFLLREEWARRQTKRYEEIPFSDLSYCDRIKVQAATGEDDNG